MGGKDFMCSGKGKRLKHQDAFEDNDSKFPYVSEPYEGVRDAETRSQWISNQKVLYGPFVSSGNSHVLEKPTRKLLPILLKRMHEELARDWEELTYRVTLTEDGNIALCFETVSLDCERGLVAYMNVFARSHPMMHEYTLSKVHEDWNTKPGDGGLYFVFRPPWVRNTLLRHNLFSIARSTTISSSKNKY